MKEVPANKKKSLGKLPTPVRNKMGYMEEGGSVPKIKKGSPEDKVKKKFLDTNPLFKLEKKVKNKLKEKLEKKKKRGTPIISKKRGSVRGKAPVRYTPSGPRNSFGKKRSDPAAPAISTRKRNDQGPERSIDVMKERMKRKSGMNKGGIVDRNYLKGR
tara:strand:+ start:245 stop:718 length:474 start_codon:yes stop_codon:yes gene_type:complete